MRTNLSKPDPLQPRFTVGRDHHGCWIVRDRLDRVGGLFASEDAARHFAFGEADHDASQICLADGAMELSLASVGTHSVH